MVVCFVDGALRAGAVLPTGLCVRRLPHRGPEGKGERGLRQATQVLIWESPRRRREPELASAAAPGLHRHAPAPSLVTWLSSTTFAETACVSTRSWPTNARPRRRLRAWMWK